MERKGVRLVAGDGHVAFQYLRGDEFLFGMSRSRGDCLELVCGQHARWTLRYARVDGDGYSTVGIFQRRFIVSYFWYR